VLFPTLARFAARGAHADLRATMANGMRQIVFVLLPAAAAVLVLSDPMVRLVYQRGEFDASQTQLVSTALFWFAFSLPSNGLFLLLTRTFFSLQRPWIPTVISGANLLLTSLAALALYGPFGIGGIVASTAIATGVSVFAQCAILRRELGGLELGRLADSTLRVGAASASLAGISFVVWDLLDSALGRSLGGQLISLSTGLGAGALVYLGVVWLLRVPELDQIMRLLRRR
jgi:putative peptidoglycan lipid II flippase